MHGKKGITIKRQRRKDDDGTEYIIKNEIDTSRESAKIPSHFQKLMMAFVHDVNGERGDRELRWIVEMTGVSNKVCGKVR